MKNDWLEPNSAGTREFISLSVDECFPVNEMRSARVNKISECLISRDFKSRQFYQTRWKWTRNANLRFITYLETPGAVVIPERHFQIVHNWCGLFYSETVGTQITNVPYTYQVPNSFGFVSSYSVIWFFARLSELCGLWPQKRTWFISKKLVRNLWILASSYLSTSLLALLAKAKTKTWNEYLTYLNFGLYTKLEPIPVGRVNIFQQIKGELSFLMVINKTCLSPRQKSLLIENHPLHTDSLTVTSTALLLLTPSVDWISSQAAIYFGFYLFTSVREPRRMTLRIRELKCRRLKIMVNVFFSDYPLLSLYSIS